MNILRTLTSASGQNPLAAAQHHRRLPDHVSLTWDKIQIQTSKDAYSFHIIVKSKNLKSNYGKLGTICICGNSKEDHPPHTHTLSTSSPPAFSLESTKIERSLPLLHISKSVSVVTLLASSSRQFRAVLGMNTGAGARPLRLKSHPVRP